MLLRLQFTEGERQAIQPVVVGAVAEDGCARAAVQHMRNGLFGRRLADAAGDADDLDLLPGERQVRPRVTASGIGHDDHGGRLIREFNRTFTQDAGHALRKRASRM